MERAQDHVESVALVLGSKVLTSRFYIRQLILFKLDLKETECQDGN
jgi:hypothetical protein